MIRSTHTFRTFAGKAFLLMLLVSGCEEEQVLPIEKEILVPVLMDIHVAEVALQQVGKLNRDSMQEVYFGQVFDIHQVRKEDFESTIELMRRDPVLLREIYDEVYSKMDDWDRANSE